MPAKIKYNDNVIASVAPGQTATVKLKGSVPQSDIEIDLTQISGGSSEAVLQEKTITENGEYTPDEGYDGFSKVTANVPERYEEGYQDGKQAEHDTFWDEYQQNGTRTDYRSAFGGIGWGNNAFSPKYDMQPTNANNMFTNSSITDLPATLEKAGVTLDLSKASTAQQIFLETKAKNIGVVDLSNCGYATYLIAYSTSLETVERVVFSENLRNIVSGFAGCTALKNIHFGGIIPISVSFVDSPLLTNESVQSIIDHLKDLTGATAQTLTFHATVGGNMTESQKTAISQKNWTLVY